MRLRAALLAILLAAAAAAQQAALPAPRPAAVPAVGLSPAQVEGNANAPDPAMGDDPAQFLGAGVELVLLDKFAATSTAFAAPIGEQTAIARLRVTPRACRESAQGEMVYLEIIDDSSGDAPVFSGWMFADSPALSALDNPRYDLWLISCSTR